MDGQPEQERRGHKRLPFREDILVDGASLCTSMDISEAGLFVSAIQFFEENDVVEIAIPFKGEKITVRAQVKFSQQGIGAGMMFIDLNEEQKAKIKELVESIERTD